METARLHLQMAPPPNRQYADNPDATERWKIHFIYAVPAGGVDRGFDLTPSIPYSVSSANRWPASQIRKKFVLDTYENHLDITFVALPNFGAFYQIQGVFKHNWIVEDLSRLGMLQPGKMYVIYNEGGHVSACADAAYRGQTEVVCMTACGVDTNALAASPAADPDYHEFLFLHEMVHLTTGISLDAPNEAAFGHVGDSPEDLMYSGDQVWTPSIVDYNKDDYCNRKALPAGTANLTDAPLLSR